MAFACILCACEAPAPEGGASAPPESGQQASIEDTYETLPFDEFFDESFIEEFESSGEKAVYSGESGNEAKEFCYTYRVKENCVDKKDMLDKLDSERYLFNIVDKMLVGEDYNFSLIIDPSGRLDANRAFRGEPGQIGEGITKVSLKMEAELTGPTFEIQPQGRIERELSVLSPTRWDWSVKPLAAGKRPLQFSLYVALLGPDGNKIAEDNPLVERRTIFVDITWIDWAAELAKKINPIYALLAALATSAAGVLAWIATRKKKNGNSVS